MWDGYATLQQPTKAGAGGKGIGIIDLLLPSRISKVDQAMAANWFRPPKQGSQPGINPAAGNPSTLAPGTPIGPGGYPIA